jgi:DNA-3-methyladenine glycosylase
MNKLHLDFYLHNDVVTIARSLLGCKLYSNINGVITGGIITETEAYEGITDKASHAYGGIRTNRTEVMYQKGGITYVYLCYGIHYLLNVVTGDLNNPHAVLLRGIYPLTGSSTMLRRTNKKKVDYNLTNGPGKLTKAMGIDTEYNGISYNGSKIWIEEGDFEINPEDISSRPRIGIDYAEEDAKLPYRFVLNYNNYTKKMP